MSVISNTTVLSNFAVVEQLDLLQRISLHGFIVAKPHHLQSLPNASGCSSRTIGVPEMLPIHKVLPFRAH